MRSIYRTAQTCYGKHMAYEFLYDARMKRTRIVETEMRSLQTGITNTARARVDKCMLLYYR